MAAAFATLGAVATLADRPAAMWARTLSPSWRLPAEIITAFGSSGYMFAAAALVFLGSAVMAGEPGERPLHRQAGEAASQAVQLIVTLALSGIATQLIKHLVGRVRPRFSPVLDSGAFHPIGFANADASFPSGHTTSAFAAATILGLRFPRSRGALVGAAVLIGASRIVLGEHYPSDVVAGAGLGLSVSLVVARSRWVAGIENRLWRRALAVVSHGRLEPTGVRALVHGRWSLPLLVGACFALGSPPADLFGSAAAEHVKDGLAVLTALGGLTLRGAAISASAAGPVSFAAMPAGWRAPFRLGSVMVVLGIVLMHGALLTIALGLAAALAIFGPSPSEPAETGRPAQRAPALDLGRVLTGDSPVIGTTIVALALAEFWEELSQPHLASSLTELAGLAAIMLVGSLGMIVGTLAQKPLRSRKGA